MKNNNSALFYKKTKYDSWHSERHDMPVQLWEYYAHKQSYARFDIRNLKEDDTYYLHQTTNVVRFNRKYYLPEEKIPYPEKEPKNIDNFEITVLWEDENNFFDSDYDEIYSRLDGLCTVVETDLGYIIVQCFTESFQEFLEKLTREKQAVFHNEEITYFKWLCWLKDDKVRVIQQEYNGKYVKTFFDFLIDKELFFSECEKMLNKMLMYEKKDLKRYQDYALKKYGKLLKISVPYPETEPLQIGSFEIITEVQTNTESDFEEFFKTGDIICHGHFQECCISIFRLCFRLCMGLRLLPYQTKRMSVLSDFKTENVRV